MRKPQGYATISDPELGLKEWDTVTCSHCQRIQAVKPLAPASECGGWCPGCSKVVCGPCADRIPLHGCEIWERQMDKMEARDRLLRAVGV